MGKGEFDQLRVWRTRMHYRKKATLQRQCDAWSNVLLGNLGSCHACRHHYLRMEMALPLSAGEYALPQSKNGSGIV